MWWTGTYLLERMDEEKALSHELAMCILWTHIL
jgi:hypothetical protein